MYKYEINHSVIRGSQTTDNKIRYYAHITVSIHKEVTGKLRLMESIDQCIEGNKNITDKRIERALMYMRAKAIQMVGYYNEIVKIRLHYSIEPTKRIIK